MRAFRGMRGWVLGLPLAAILPDLARAEGPRCRMECDAGVVTNVAEVRTCFARCEVRLVALGSRGPTGTTAMPNPRTPWTTGPRGAGRTVAPPTTPARRAGPRAAVTSLPRTPAAAMAQAAPRTASSTPSGPAPARRPG